MATRLPSNADDRELRRAAVRFGQGLFSVRETSGQTITAGAGDVVVNFNTEEYNHDGWYSTSTYKFIPKQPGYYLFSCSVYATAARTAAAVISLAVNGTAVRIIERRAEGWTLSGSCIYYMNGDTDYAQIVVGAATDNFVLSNGTTKNYFQGVLISTKP